MRKNKLLYRIFILFAFILLNVLILFGIGKVLSYLNSGANKAKLFHGDITKEILYTPELSWIDLNNPGRVLEDAVRSEINNDYMVSWYIRNIAMNSWDKSGIEDLYTKHARTHLFALIDHNEANGISIESTTLEHHIDLDFYSADGTMVAFTDKNVNSFSRVFQNNELVHESNERASYKVIMLLEDGFWRIRHMKRVMTSAEQMQPTEHPEFKGPIKGINYYPKDAAWDTFGEDFDSVVISNDFKIISELGLNTIRIFVNYSDFGKATVATDKLNRLHKLMDIASENDLSVIVTLFDFYGDYSLTDWTLTQSHALQIVKSLKSHNALHSWDLKNEPDLDFKNRDEKVVKAWLSQMLKVVRSEDTMHPVTIGWSSPEAAATLSDEVDYVSFHFYKDIETLSTAISSLKERTDKPLVLQEFGLSTNRGLWSPFGNDDEDQVAYYDAFFKTQKRDSINYLSWTLYDFSTIPDQVAGQLPWRKNKQSHFGIITKEGAKKAVFSTIKSEN